MNSHSKDQVVIMAAPVSDGGSGDNVRFLVFVGAELPVHLLLLGHIPAVRMGSDTFRAKSLTVMESLCELLRLLQLCSHDDFCDKCRQLNLNYG
jgi:hypothetical protein